MCNPARTALHVLRALGLLGPILIASPSAAQVTFPKSGITVDVGGAVRERPNYLGSNNYTTDFVPVLDGQWGPNLHFSIDDGIQYSLLRYGAITLGPDLEYRQPYNDHLAPRSNRTANAIEAGVFGKLNLTYAELEGRLRKAVNGYEGYSGDLSLDTLIPVRPKLWLALEARFGWADRKYATNLFMRTPSASGIGDYYSGGIQATLIYQVLPRWKLGVSFSDDQILRPSRPASGANTRNTRTAVLGLTRRFSW